MRIVRKYVLMSTAAGLITLPVVDVVTEAGVHVALIKELTEYYGGEFSEHTARNVLIALAASLVPGMVGSIVGRKALSLLSSIKTSAGLAGLVVMSGLSGVVAYGLGLLFISHFEQGGTLDTFNVKNLHKAFKHAITQA